jgi:hypothetical protein
MLLTTANAPSSRALKNLMIQIQSYPFKVSYNDVYKEVRNLTDATDSINPNEHAIYSVEYGKITHRQIINKCRRVFHGQDNRIRTSEALLFDKETVNKVGLAYEVINEIKILREDEDKDEYEENITSDGTDSDSGSITDHFFSH